MADFKHVKATMVVRTRGVSTGRIARRVRDESRLKPGQVECVVCGHPGRPLPPDQDSRHHLGQGYQHDGRFVLCRTLGFWSIDTKLIGALK